MRKRLLSLCLLLAILLGATPASAAISLIAGFPVTAASTDSQFTTAQTGSVDSTGATLLVMARQCYNDRGAGITVLDNKSNTWTKLTTYGSGGSLLSTVDIWYVDSATPTVGSGHTFQSGLSGSAGYPTIWVWAFSGTGASPFRNESGNTATSSPTSISPAGSVGANGDVVITVVANNLGTGTAQAVDSAFTKSTNYGFVGSTHAAGSAAYKIVSAAETPGWSGLDGSDAAVASAAFQPSGGGGGATPKCGSGMLLRGAGCEVHP